MIKVFCSKNSYLLLQKRKKIEKNFSEQGFEIFLIQNDNFDFEKLFLEIENFQLFSSKKKVFLLSDCFDKLKQKELEKLKSKKDVDIIFFEFLSDKRNLNKFKKDFDIYLEFIEDLKDEALLRWAKEKFGFFNVKIKDDVLDFLIEGCDKDMWLIENYIKKIIAFLGDKKEVSFEDVLKNINQKTEVNIFSTINYIFGDKKKGLRFLLNHIKKGDNPLFLLSMIEYQLRTILEFLQAKEGRVFLKKNFKYAEIKNIKIDFQTASKLYNDLMILDFKIKQGLLDPQQALEKLFYKIP
ncbi:hypothetical protein HRbin34_00429 [bacterium HR34]|nr:hypothetical protein HRbin34_00429 [bacterium HR34]